MVACYRALAFVARFYGSMRRSHRVVTASRLLIDSEHGQEKSRKEKEGYWQAETTTKEKGSGKKEDCRKKETCAEEEDRREEKIWPSCHSIAPR